MRVLRFLCFATLAFLINSSLLLASEEKKNESPCGSPTNLELSRSLERNAEAQSPPLFPTLFEIMPSARDTFDASKSLVQGSTWTEAGEVKDERIDFIFSLGSPVTGYSTITDKIHPGITDHLASVGTFSFLSQP